MLSRPDHGESTSALSRTTMADALFSTDLLEALPDAIVAVDGDGIIVQVNSQAQELFGYFREELIGQKVEILVPEAYRAQHHSHRQTFAETPKTRRMGADLDLYGRRRNGSEFPVEIALSPVSTEKGSFVLSAIRDITDRKRIAEELRRANEELYGRQSNRSANTAPGWRPLSILPKTRFSVRISTAPLPVGIAAPSGCTVTLWKKSWASTFPFLLRPIARTKSARFFNKLLPGKTSSTASQFASPKMVGT